MYRIYNDDFATAMTFCLSQSRIVANLIKVQQTVTDEKLVEFYLFGVYTFKALAVQKVSCCCQDEQQHTPDLHSNTGFTVQQKTLLFEKSISGGKLL